MAFTKLLEGSFQVAHWINENLLQNCAWKVTKETVRRNLALAEDVDEKDIDKGVLKASRESEGDPFMIQSSNWIDPNCNVVGNAGAAEILKTSTKQIERYKADSPENGFAYDKLFGTPLWVQGSLEWFGEHLKKRGPYKK